MEYAISMKRNGLQLVDPERAHTFVARILSVYRSVGQYSGHTVGRFSV